MRDLLALPKAHLHLHLEGAMRPATLTELADRYTITLEPTPGFGSFAVFIDTYTAACQVLRSDDDLRRLVRELVEDAALAGAVWVEPSLGPATHRGRLGPDHDVVALSWRKVNAPPKSAASGSA